MVMFAYSSCASYSYKFSYIILLYEYMGSEQLQIFP